MRAAPTILVGTMFLATPTDADVVERRGVAPAIEGRVTMIDDSGISLRDASGILHLVTWDRVRLVEMDQPDPRLAAMMPVAEMAWRARTRLQRGDRAMAEPLLARLHERYAGQNGELALVVAEGLLRCRVARGDVEGAVWPALEVARLRRRGVTTDAYAELDPVFDETTDLCVGVPPAWMLGTRRAALVHDLEVLENGPDAVVRAMARLYRLTASGEAIEIPADLPEHDGVAFLARLLSLQVEDDATSTGARDDLLGRLSSMPPWQEAWARFHLGSMMLRDPEEGRRRDGLVHLAHLPARFSTSHPFLAGLAMEAMAVEFQRVGATRDAATIRSELRRTWPGHPLNTNQSARSPGG